MVVSMMVMYEDESLEVRYGDGSCLQLSPCGSEFVLEKSILSSAHPLQPSEKVRQRTRFVTSVYKDLMVQALEFRNRFATRPYLPEELIPTKCRMHFFTDISEIEWPASSSCGLEFGSNGEAIISSLDGNASLLLSPSREEFSVEFLCRASQNEGQRAVSNDSKKKPVLQPVKSQDNSTTRLNTQQTIAGTLRITGAKENGQKGVQPREAHLYTRVVQHHSCFCSPPVWSYPLSLVLSLWNTQQEKPNEINVEVDAGAAERHPGHSAVPSSSMGERCRLPEALPLRCPSPHQHRWNFRDSLQRCEQDPEQGLRTDVVKVLWCQGVVYRLIIGAITTIEISPGDGSVIRSNGAVANYFTHHTASLAPGQSEEKKYFVNSLPPDVPGQVYSVCSAVTRASRILKCYNQARLSLKLPNSHCCWREESSSLDTSVLIQEAHVAGSGHFMAFSDGRVHVIFLDGVTLRMIWNFNTSTPTQRAVRATQPPGEAAQLHGWCQFVLPDGQQQLIQLQAPGSYSRHVSAAVQWCQWVEQTTQNTGETSCAIQSIKPGQSWSVVAELEKIKRFNFLLEHSGLLRTAGDSAGASWGLQEVVTRNDPGTASAVVTESSVAEALQRTTRAIQDIETLLSVKSSSHNSTA